MSEMYIWKVNIPDYGDDEYSEFKSPRSGTFEIDYPWVAEDYACHLCNDRYGNHYSDFETGCVVKVISPGGVEKAFEVHVELVPSFRSYEVE